MFKRRVIVVLLAAVMPCASALATTLRIVNYNIDDDTGAANNGTAARTNMTDLGIILQAIGNEHLAGNVQPIDVLALNELHYDNPSTSSSLTAIVNVLNGIYGAGTYAFDTFVGTSSGGNQPGNGPNGLIYNTKTVKDLGAVGISKEADGTTTLVGGSGAAREPVRYELQPVGYDTNSDFYIYVSHYKALSGSEARRQVEADAVRANADALGSSAHIIYTGDFNLTGKGGQTSRTEKGSTEPAYLDLTAAGNGQAVDPLNATGWDNTSAFTPILTEAGDNLTARFDFQLVTNAMVNQPGMQIVPNTYTAFGNSSTMTFGKAVDISSNTAALTDLSNRTTVLQLLSDNTDVTDHLPIVADYQTVGIAPLPPNWLGGAFNYSNSAKWSTGLVPNDPLVQVQIDNGNSSASVVTLDQDATVNSLTLNTNDTFIISSGRTFTIDGPAATAFNGTVTNSGTLKLTGGSITTSGEFQSTGVLNIAGNFTSSGTTTISGTQTWAAGSTFTNTAGTATFNTDAGSATASTLTINATGGTVNFGSTQHLAGLSIGAGATVNAVLSSPNTVIATQSLTVSGVLNLTNNDLVLQGASPTAAAANLTTIRTALQNGFNASAGYWNGSTGIVSTKAAGDTQFLTTLGYLQSPGGTFDGVSTTTNDVLVKYTYYGDANLDGVVNGADYQQIDAGFGTGATDWSHGDFNYDGVVNGSDFALIDNTFNQISATGAASLAIVANPADSVAVPEPTSLALLAFGSVAFLRRRRSIHA